MTKGTQKGGRQPSLFIICGETGIGKTRRSLIEIFEYLKKNKITGKKARKILAFDANADDYPMFRTVSLDHIKNLKTAQARRVLPFKSDGTLMNLEEKREVVEKLVRQFKNGLLILEDLDKYMTGAKGQAVIGLLTTNRHSGLDIMVSHQSIAKVTTTEWQNCTWLRLHHQVDDISRYKDRIPNYFIVRLASYIVNEQYDLAIQALEDEEITNQESLYYKSFFVYVDMRSLKIRGCSKEAFIRASKKLMDTDYQRQLKTMLLERNWDDSPIYRTRKEAELKVLKDLFRHYQSKA